MYKLTLNYINTSFCRVVFTLSYSWFTKYLARDYFSSKMPSLKQHESVENRKILSVKETFPFFPMNFRYARNNHAHICLSRSNCGFVYTFWANAPPLTGSWSAPLDFPWNFGVTRGDLLWVMSRSSSSESLCSLIVFKMSSRAVAICSAVPLIVIILSSAELRGKINHHLITDYMETLCASRRFKMGKKQRKNIF